MYMQKFYHIIAACLTLLLLAPPLYAQEEMLVGIQAPRQRSAHTAAAKSKRLLKDVSASSEKLDTLSLPFFDDFSGATNGIPDRRKWRDRYVFINNTYGINQPTMGVATFDIADEHGFIYKNAALPHFAADALTSMPIRLQLADANVYLSFAYQPAGTGDMPERRDSLTLQFFSPADSAWITMWSARTDTIGGALKPNAVKEKRYWISLADVVRRDSSIASTFFKVVVPVSDERFLDTGFCFRFVNYATRAQDDVLGRQSDCDMWNLDMVYLNKNRSAADTVMMDVAIQTPVLRLLKDYTSMPWRHLKGSLTAQVEQLTRGQSVVISPVISNMYNGENSFLRSVELACVKGSSGSSAKPYYPSGTIDLPASTTRPIDYTLSSNAIDILNMPMADADSVAFDIKVIVSNYKVGPNELAAALASNDTSAFRQNFYTYYAYDDGTAENGYGVYGDQADRAKVAVKFKSYLRDTLSGIYIYFNNSLDSGNIQPFRLAVWSDRGGEPGNELYMEPNRYAQFDSLNSYVHYKLSRPVVIEKDATFYVGWVQQSTAMFNVGFDVNDKVVGKNYVSTNGFTWSVSKYDGQGAIMIRPSFAKQNFDPSTSVEDRRTNMYSVKVYPNPVSDELYLDLPEALREKDVQLEIFNLSGARVMLAAAAVGASVSVAHLGQGTYFVRFSHEGKPVGYARFIKR